MGRVRRRTWVEAERRRHRSLAALTALTILAGVFASMVGREASPAAALDARRLTDIASVDNQTFVAEGGVADVAISADGNWMAIATTASLADIDDEIPPDNPDVCSPTCPDNDMDVYVVATSGLGPARLITDDQHPVGAVFWTVIPDIDISGDGRWVSWVMVDESSIILFAPPISGSKASPAAVPPGSNDVDGGRDVFVAEVDPDGDQNLNTSPESFDGHIGAGPFQLASLTPGTLNNDLGTNSHPSLSYSGRFLAYNQSLRVFVHDRDADPDGPDGVLDEQTTSEQTTTEIAGPVTAPAVSLPSISSSPDPALDGAFVVFQAVNPQSTAQTIRVWQRSTGLTYDATAPGVVLVGTPDITADGTKVTYDARLNGSDASRLFNRQIVVVSRDTASGALIAGAEEVISKIPGADLETTAGDDDSVTPVISEDGRYVAFSSEASNFGTTPPVHGENCIGQTVGGESCLVYAVDLGQPPGADRTPVLVSGDHVIFGSGQAANGRSFAPTISATGDIIGFVSEATNFFTPTNVTPNAFSVRWDVNVFATPEQTTFPDTAVGGTFGPVAVAFETQDFGPWTAPTLDLLDGYVDPGEHDFTVAGACDRAFHANDPCTLQVTFVPIELGNRAAELCIRRSVDFSSCEATMRLGGDAVPPDGIGQIDRVSVGQGPGGAELGNFSESPVVSANGRYVAFVTPVAVAGQPDENFVQDVYVRDRLRSTTTLISRTPLNGPDGPSFEPTISADGRFIAFSSRAVKDPTDGGDGSSSDIFLVDRGTPDTNGDFSATPGLPQLVSIPPDPAFGSADFVDPSISGDGTQIAFEVDIDFPLTEVYVRDRTAGRTISVADTGLMPAGADDLVDPAISADGSHVAFVADTNLAAGTTSVPATFSDVVYVYDRDLNGDGTRDTAGDSRIVRVTSDAYTSVLVDPAGEAGFEDRSFALELTESSDPVIDGDGSTVAYAFRQEYDDYDADEDGIPDLATPLPADGDQIVVLDRNAADGTPGAPTVVSVAGPGDPNKTEFDNIAENAGQACSIGEGGSGQDCFGVDSATPDISDDGRYVTFTTQASNLLVQPGIEVAGGSDCGDDSSTFGSLPQPDFDGCDVLVVDRTAPALAGGPQQVNTPPVAVVDPTDFDPFAFVPDRSYGTAVISGDGRFIAFESDAEYLLGYRADDLTPDPSSGLPDCGPCPIDDNGVSDIFLRDWQPVVDPPAATELAFAETTVGATSAIQSAMVTTADFGPAPVLGVALAGANPGDFVLTGTTNCLPPLSSAPVAPVAPVPDYGIVHLDTPCTASVAFAPTVGGTRTATLVFTLGHPFSTAPAATFEVPLVGGGVAPPGTGAVSIDPTTVDLGDSIVTVQTPPADVTVTNTGTGPLQITAVTLTGPTPGDFVIVLDQCTGVTLLPGQSCVVRVAFKPTNPTPADLDPSDEDFAEAVLQITDDSGSPPRLVTLRGTGLQGTLVLNPGVTIGGRTIEVLGQNWAPNQPVIVTMADLLNPSRTFPEATILVANDFGVIDGSILVLPRSITGPRIVIASGTPATLTAFQPLLVSVATINGPDFVSRS